MRFFKAIGVLWLIIGLIAVSAYATDTINGLSVDTKLDGDSINMADVNSVSFQKGDVINIDLRLTSPANLSNVEVVAMISGYEFNKMEPMSDSTQIFDMDANVTYRKSLSITVPVEIDQDSYLLRVVVSDRNSRTSVFEYKLKLDALRHGFLIQDVVFSPGNVIEAGRALLSTVRLENLGDRSEQSVKVTVAIPSLGLTASDFIDKIGIGDSETTEEMYLRIPPCAKAGDYPTIIEVKYNSLREAIYENAVITVVPSDACEATIPKESADTSSGKTVIAVGATTQEITVGKAGALFPLTITNNAASSKTYTVTVEGTNSFATAQINPVSTFVLGKDESQAVFVYLTALDNAASGQNVFTVTVQSGGEVLKQIPMTAVVTKAQAGATQTVPAQMDLRNALEIGLIVLVVILIILAIVIGVNKMKKDGGKEGDEEEIEGKTYY